jgi:hypothetical protein
MALTAFFVAATGITLRLIAVYPTATTTLRTIATTTVAVAWSWFRISKYKINNIYTLNNLFVLPAHAANSRGDPCGRPKEWGLVALRERPHF